jgi:hypothetical protein
LNADLNFGTVSVESLTLDLLANHRGHALIAILFRLLTETQFPRLRSLHLHLGDYRCYARENRDEWKDWDPFELASVRKGQWALAPGLAAQLARVTLDLSDFDGIVNARAFFALFGAAGRPEVMLVTPERVVVNPDPPRAEGYVLEDPQRDG